jgi:uncharacterized protein
MSGTDALGPLLLVRARNAVAAEFGFAPMPVADHPRLHEPGACFVTLFTRGVLHGCVGSLDPSQPLGVDVESNARGAAFRDPRFAPLTRDELAQTRFEVSLIGPSTPIAATTERDALAALVPHRDGVTLSWHRHRSTLLPQVWSSLPEPRSFMQALKQKAGLPADFWDADVRIERYSVVHYEESPEAVQ